VDIPPPPLDPSTPPPVAADDDLSPGSGSSDVDESDDSPGEAADVVEEEPPPAEEEPTEEEPLPVEEEPTEMEPVEDLGDALSFERDVHPFLERLCGPCHATQGVAGHNVGSPNVDVAYDFALRLGNRLVQRSAGSMPPRSRCSGEIGTPGCLTAEELATLEDWFEQGSPP
jgi:hypothetical protein